MTADPHTEYKDQIQALEELMGAYRYVPTSFEADAWLRIIASVRKEVFLSFLQHHYATSGFAPKPSDASKHLDLALNQDAAFESLVALVSSVGPHQSPVGVDPVLHTAIQALGGWVAVNSQMPDPSNVSAVRAYRERFSAVYAEALSKVRVHRMLPDQPLLSLHDKADHLRLPGSQSTPSLERPRT